MTPTDGNYAASNGAGVAPLDDERALQELRALLLGKDQEELVALRERLDNLKIRAQDVSEVVAEALRLRESADREHELSRILQPEVEVALRESVRKDATILAEALYPVMGPAIRKSIYEAIRALIESFNEALSRGFSIRGLKWRIEAIRTGRPFAEVVLLHTLVFRVEQVFLIHKKTGLLLHHLATPQLGIQDPDMVSGMLSAIQDYVRDSFSAPQGTSVNTMQVGELQVWVEQGPDAVLACVIRGHAPQRIRFKLRERLEKVHQVFNRELAAFDGDALPFLNATEILGDCLESQLGDDEASRHKAFAVVLASLVVMLGLAWGAFALIQGRKWNRFVEALQHEPGIVVTSSYSRGGRHHIQGLRDSFASNPAELASKAGLDPGQVVFEWRGFDSSDDPVVLKRAAAFLEPPSTVALSVRQGMLIVRGNSKSDWASKVRTFGPLIPGVRGVNTANLTDLGPFEKEKAALESYIVYFPTGQNRIPTDERAHIKEIAETLRELLASSQEANLPVRIEIIGHTDSTGAERSNSLLSERRAQSVERGLLIPGVSDNFLRSRGVSNLEPVREEATEADRHFNRSVTFRVVPSDSAEKR